MANPLIDKAKQAFPSQWTAMDYVRRAREKGDHKMESLWLAEAKRRGEIPSYGD